MEGPFKWWLWLCDEAGKIVIFSQFKMNWNWTPLPPKN
jgi:hypothetical protein